MIVKFTNEETHEQMTVRDLPPGVEITPEAIRVTGGDGVRVIAVADETNAGWLVYAANGSLVTEIIWPTFFIHEDESIFSSEGAQFQEV